MEDKQKKTFQIVVDVPAELECMKGSIETACSGIVSAMAASLNIGFLKGVVDETMRSIKEGGE